MGKASFTQIKPWRNTMLMMLGLAILISGFAQISQPLFSAATPDVEVSTNLELATAAAIVSPLPLLNTPSNYCARPTTHFGGNAPSAILLTIANLDANTMYVEIESATASPVDLLLVENIVGGIVSAPTTPSPGVIRRTITWAAPPANVTINVLWSHADFGGNWQLSQAPIMVPFAAVCGGTPPPASQYCDRPTTHFGGNPPSAILLTIENLNANSIYVEIESATASPVDLLLVENIVGGTVSAPTTPSPGVIRRTVTWAVPPTDVIINVLWSHADFGGNWQLSQAPITVPFAAVCGGTPPPPPPPTAPSVAAPTPTCGAENVISMFSDAYTNVGVNTWLTPWSGASGGGIVPIAGNPTRLYENVNFLGIETTGANLIDASEMDFFHIDVWTPNMTTFRVKLVDFGPNGNFQGGDDTEFEIAFTPTLGEWNSYRIPLSDFVGMNTSNIAQLILSGIPVGQGKLYIDNVYFSTCGIPSAYCNTEVRHLGIAAETASAVNLSIGNSGPNTITIEVSSATASPVDLLLINGAAGATISPTEEVSPGVLRSILTWGGAPPANVTLNVLWSKANFGGNWQLSQGNITIPFEAVCETIEPVPTAPTTTPPAPSCEQSRVISMFSDAYTDVAVNTWLTPWSSATGGGVVTEAGNQVRFYQNVDFLGIETTGANLIDATEMNFFHIDIWTPNMTTFRVKLVDFGANGVFQAGDDTEGEIVFNNVPLRQWVGYDIPLSAFGGMNRANIAQLILSGIPVGQGRVYIDNVYFSGCVQQSNVGCESGSNVNLNETTGVYTISSTNCTYGSPFTKDNMAFAAATMCGNGTITAQVTSVTGNGWAGITLRENNGQNAKKAQLMTNLNAFNRREVRYTTGGSSFPQNFSAQGRYWLRLVRTGNQIIGYVSANGQSWNNIMVAAVSMNSCVEVGLVVTNASPNNTVTATFGNVSISGANNLGGGDDTPNIDQGGLQARTLLSAYPNPTTGHTTLDLSAFADQDATLMVQDAYGRTLRVERLGALTNATEQLDLSGLPAGVYYVRLRLNDSEEHVQRIVVQPRP